MAISGPTPVSATSPGAVSARAVRGAGRARRSRRLRSIDPPGQAAQGDLGDRGRSVRPVLRNFEQPSDELLAGRAAQVGADLIRCGGDEAAHLVERLGLGLAGRAAGDTQDTHALRRPRPGSWRSLSASPHWAARAAVIASCGSDLPRRRRRCRFGRSTSTTGDVVGVEVAGEAGAVAAGALDAGQLELTERTGPAEQLGVAGRGGVERCRRRAVRRVRRARRRRGRRGACRHRS